MEQNKEEYSVIKYVSDSEESRLMLFLLSESINGLEFDELNRENQISETVIRKLLDFELVETDKSVAHGRTMTYVVRTSRYYLTDYGENFYNLLTALSEVREKTVIPQLTVGEFTRFKKELDKFINSENSDEVISSYEFIFGTEIANGNFYKRCEKKLKYLLKAIIDLRRAILSIASDKAHKKTINEFSLKVTEFADIAGEISSVLRKEGNNIKKSLDKLSKYKETSFYEERAKKITGIRFDENSATTLEKRVLKFVSEINARGVYSAFSGRIKDIIDEARNTKKQLEKLKNQIEDKEAIRALASKIAKLDEEDAKQLFLKIVSNRKIHHLSENEYSTFSNGILEVKMPEVKQREKNKRKEDLEIDEDLELIRLESKLKDAKNYYNELKMFKKISNYKNGEVIEDIDEYNCLRGILLNTEDDKEAKAKLLYATISPNPNKDFILKHPLGRGKIQQLTLKNSEVTFNVKQNFELYLSKAKRDISSIAARIADKESNQQKSKENLPIPQ